MSVEVRQCENCNEEYTDSYDANDQYRFCSHDCELDFQDRVESQSEYNDDFDYSMNY